LDYLGCVGPHSLNILAVTPLLVAFFSD
jgi:hypothetical protein